MSPPYIRAWPLLMLKPLSENPTTPRARSSRGVAGVICTSLPARVTLPCTVDLSSAPSGKFSFRRRSALPVPVARARAWLVIWLTGEPFTTASMVARGPRASALSSTVAPCSKSGISPSADVICRPGEPGLPDASAGAAMRPLTPLTCSDTRSIKNSPDSCVSSGQGKVSGAAMLRGT